MYGYRQPLDNGLMTNLNSISSSLSSIDTIGRRTNPKASVDNLITQRSHSINSTSLLWKAAKNSRHLANLSTREGSRYAGSEIYYSGGKRSSKLCLKSCTALNLILVPLLVLTIARQIFDFLGQIWLQILVNFFTIIVIIVGLFGIKQKRISYLCLFTLWSLFNTVWNIVIICIHTKARDVGLNEDALSFYTGATGWWQLHGPGCTPYNLSSIQPSISILQPNIITGCRVDYHHIEAAQAAIHSIISLMAALFCCCVMSNIMRSPKKTSANSDKLYRLDNLTSDRMKINSNPYPTHTSSKPISTHTGSLRRAANKTTSRSSQHSVSSQRSARRRNRYSTDGNSQTPRGSTSSAQRSQKYGSISSRRSNKKKDRRGDCSSTNYGTTGDRPSSVRRRRPSSQSSADYLPSYQPPHSSNANLLSSYGEISSIDSYNNSKSGYRRSQNGHASAKSASRGNTNPTYIGSRSSICSHNTNTNNYDDLSYIYGNNNTKNSENLYGPSTSAASDHRQRSQSNQNRANSLAEKSAYASHSQVSNLPHTIQAETHRSEGLEGAHKGDTITKIKAPLANGTFQSFTVGNQQNIARSQKQFLDVNNNSAINQTNQIQANGDMNTQHISSYDYGARALENKPTIPTSVNQTQQQIYINQRTSRHPIYSNQNGNSETPI